MRRAKGVGSAVSIRMVAELANVSAATVSNALNGKPSVSPDLARRVREAAETLGYAGDNHASRLRSGKRALAGVVVPDLSNPMFGAFVSTLERSARRDGLDLLVVSCANDPAEEAERLRSLRSWRPSGLIVIPCDGALAARLPRGAMPPRSSSPTASRTRRPSTSSRSTMRGRRVPSRPTSPPRAAATAS